MMEIKIFILTYHCLYFVQLLALPLDCSIADSVSCSLEGGEFICQGNVTNYSFVIDPFLPNSSNNLSVTFRNAIHGLIYNITWCPTGLAEKCGEKCNHEQLERKADIDKNILANVEANDDSITINCTVWEKRMLHATYHFEMSNQALTFSRAKRLNWGKQCLMTFKDLKPGKVYDVSVFGSTVNNKSSPKISRVLVTKPEDIRLKCSRRELNSLTIEVLNDTIVIEEITGYYQKTYKVYHNDSKMREEDNTEHLQNNPFRLENLDPDTPYNVTVHVELEESSSKFEKKLKVTSKGHSIVCETDIKEPKVIRCSGSQFTTQEVGSSSVNVSFPYVFDNSNGKVEHLSLELIKEHQQLFNSYQLQPKQSCSKIDYHLKDLPSSEYVVRLKATNRLNQNATHDLGTIKISSTPTGLIIALAIIIVLLIIVIVILMCLMCRCKPSGGKTVHMSKNPINITRFINPNFTLRKMSHRPSHHPVNRLPIKASRFPSHVENLEKDSGLSYSEEFEDLKCIGQNQATEDALLQCNRAKNRFVNILPYDSTRVKLQAIEDEEGSDFINANWIPGYNREYIATQGPLTSTMDDFWRMVWEHDCQAIVMLTLLVEKNKMKCEQYWPTESTAYGDLQVTVDGEIFTEKWCLRKFKVENTASDESKIVRHFQYLEWPDLNVPEINSILSFIRFIGDNLMNEAPCGPIVVQSSAGVGRSGTFIALETLLNQLENGEDIDVYGTVMEMRKNRVQMVQTEKQYMFLYRCVKEVIEKYS